MSSEPRCYSLELKNTKEKLKLTALSIDVVITAFLAKTAVTMTFMNETDHDGVEGEVCQGSHAENLFSVSTVKLVVLFWPFSGALQPLLARNHPNS